MKDPEIVYLSKRIDNLEKNQREILDLLKKVFSQDNSGMKRVSNDDPLTNSYVIDRKQG